MNNHKTLCLLLAMMTSTVCVSQYFNRTNVPVSINGNVLANAWAGGLDNCIVSEIDLNLDGKNDLLFMDVKTSKLTPFINTGTNGNISYAHAPEYITKLPVLHDWAICRDYNCDGKSDIFTYSDIAGSLKVFRNTSTLATGLQFELLTLQVNTTVQTLLTNIPVFEEQFPAFWDVDADNDLDIIAWPSFPNAKMYLQRNLSQQSGFGCDSLLFEQDSTCFGRFQLCFGTNDVCSFNISCNPQVAPDVDVYANYKPEDAAKRDDTLSSVTAFDNDGDGDADLLIGDVGSGTSLMVVNGGTNSNATMVSKDATFPSYDTPSNPYSFAIHGTADVNNDNKRDLIMLAQREGNNRTVWLYTDTAIGSVPQFHLKDSMFLQREMIDVGNYAYPQFFDYDADGLMDIVIGNDEYKPDVNGVVTGITVLRNIGSATAPAFDIIDNNKWDINAFNSTGEQSVAPAFGDMDGDGDKDMIIGRYSGKLFYFENTAGAGNPAAYTLKDAFYAGIDVGNASAPAIVDLNRDGLLDLVVGRRGHHLHYFQNSGTASLPQFSNIPTQDTLGGISFAMPNVVTSYMVPTFYQVQGTYRLAVGNEKGNVFIYDNIDGNYLGNYNLVQSVISGTEGINAAPSAYDINADGLIDFAIGNKSGGIGLFIQSTINSVADMVVPDYHVVPNPTNGIINIHTPKLLLSGIDRYSIFDTAGKLLMSGIINDNTVTIKIDHLSAGIYVLKFESGQALRIVKI